MSNSRKIYSEVYDKYVKKIYRFVLLKVNSAEIAEDLTSEVFMRGWQAYKTKQDKIENVQAFLYQIARNLLADHYRQETKVQLVSVEYAAPLTDQKPSSSSPSPPPAYWGMGRRGKSIAPCPPGWSRGFCM